MKIAINGLGRIGLGILKLAILRPEIEIVAVNDLGDINQFGLHLLRYDSVYGKSPLKIEAKKTAGAFPFVNGHKILLFSEKEPSKLPRGRGQGLTRGGGVNRIF